MKKNNISQNMLSATHNNNKSAKCKFPHFSLILLCIFDSFLMTILFLDLSGFRAFEMSCQPTFKRLIVKVSCLTAFNLDSAVLDVHWVEMQIHHARQSRSEPITTTSSTV